MSPVYLFVVFSNVAGLYTSISPCCPLDSRKHLSEQLGLVDSFIVNYL